MPKSDYALPNGATSYLNRHEEMRKILAHLYTTPDEWTKVSKLKDSYHLTDNQVISIGRRLSNFGFIESKRVANSKSPMNGKYWKLSPGYRDGIRHYLDQWNIENGVTA